MTQSITNEDVLYGKDSIMINEKNRLASFKKWSFKKGNCTKQNMAKAGFYHCNIKGEKDSVRCFVCFKSLDGWLQDDEPFTEHLKHQATCIFAKLHKEQDQLTIQEWCTILKERNKNLMNLRLKYRMEKNEEHIKSLKEILEKL